MSRKVTAMIRMATLRDLDALVSGNVRMAIETENLTLDADTVRAGVRALLEEQVAGTYWVVEDQGVVGAQLLITHEWSDWRNRDVWWIQSVYVLPERRGRGLYRKLYEFVLEEARRAGAGGLRLYVHTSNERAQGVYSTLGMDGAHYRVFEKMFDEPSRQV
jgi:GNAT superfamily N-acetyltransferase